MSDSVANAGEALVEVMARAGTEAAFGVVSIHNQPMVEGVTHGARFVTVRHEAAAVNAADAYGRVSGHLGVAITSTGTGAGNAAGSLIEALAAGSPVLHLTGQIDSEFLGQGRGVIHETKDQAAMLQAVSKDAVTVTSSNDVGAALAGAAAEAARAPMGPVSVEIPIDLQYRPTVVPAPAPHPYFGPPDADAIQAVANLLANAERPLLWLGGGATGAAPQVAELLELTGAGVLTSNAGRGTVDERDPLVVGNFAAAAGSASLLDQADLLVSIGTHFRSNETRHYHLKLPSPHVQLNIEPEAIGRSYPADLGLVGDAATVLEALNRALTPMAIGASGRNGGEPVRSEWGQRVTATRNRVRADLRADIGPYGPICDAIRAAMDETSPFVRDVTIPASTWGNRLLDVYRSDTNVYARGGGIGQGLAMALGASVARPDVPTVAMIGDGGLAVHLGEFGSVAEAQPWLVLVVFNDGGYGVLRNLQDHHFGRRSGVDLATPDFSTLATAFGIDHLPLTSSDRAEAVLAEATSLRRPVVVEVDCDAVGPMPKPFVPPVPVPGS